MLRHTHKYIKKSVSLIPFIVLFTFLYGQQPAKKELHIDDFAHWKFIDSHVISDNGKIVAYELNPQKGDGILVIGKENFMDTIPRGADVKTGAGSQFAVFRIRQPLEVVRRARLEEIEKEDMPKDSLGIYLFDENELIKFPGFKSFKLSEEESNCIAFLLSVDREHEDQVQDGCSTKDRYALVLFRMESKDTLHFENVIDYHVAKTGNKVWFIQQEEDSLSTRSKLKVYDTKAELVKEIVNDEGWIKKVVSDDEGSKYSYLYTPDTIENTMSLISGDMNKTETSVISEKSSGVPLGWSPSENGRIYYSKDGSRIFFGTAEIPEPDHKDTILEEDKPKLDIWNWKDLKLQSQQNVEMEREKKRTYLAVYFIEKNEVLQLEDPQISSVSTIQKGNGDIGLGTNDKPYLWSSNWTGKWNKDYYLVDFNSGIKREIVKDKSYVRLSPLGKYVVWYEPADSSYYARSTNINDLKIVSLTRILPVNFYDEENDEPQDPRPYGIAGFGEEDRFVYIYDRYDIWKLDPTGERVPVCMTKAFGRRNKTRLRYVKLDPELEHVPTNENILLSAIDERTMSRGFFNTKLSSVKDPDLLLMDKFQFGNPVKSKKSDQMIWTKQNAGTFPDIWLSDLNFRGIKRLSRANPDQDKYVWPEVKLVSWKSFSGGELKGLLYTPDNLRPDKKYPMVIYFYERRSENLHRYRLPSPSRSSINVSFYVSNGYIVFIPDVVYKIGYPGQSAYDAIVSGTQNLIDKYPFIDRDRIGLQGQSWGGYQTAWLITQTDMFAAAMAGAPVSNMTSAYGGIRWESGLSRMFQYERTQSRIGGSLWEKPLHYIENSPLFHAPKVKTPLLIMHNDKDGAVPWYQGIELFVALRRLEKPVWMLSYNDEPHNLSSKSWANRVDLSKRMFQFFNHYLKDKPAPEWMEKGVPAIEKEKNTGY